MSDDSKKAEALTPVAEVAESLRAWDSGEIVWTVEMGGLGPGYEQAIQVLVIELLREGATDDAAIDRALARIRGDEPSSGYSGGQVGAACGLAARVLQIGWTAAFTEVADPERKIMVSRQFPRAPEPPAVDAARGRRG